MKHRVTLTDAQARLVHEWCRDLPEDAVLPDGWPAAGEVVLPGDDSLFALRAACADVVDLDALDVLIEAAGDVSASERARLRRVAAALAKRLEDAEAVPEDEAEAVDAPADAAEDAPDAPDAGDDSTGDVDRGAEDDPAEDAPDDPADDAPGEDIELTTEVRVLGRHRFQAVCSDGWESPVMRIASSAERLARRHLEERGAL